DHSVNRGRQDPQPVQAVAFASRGKVLAAYDGADLVLRDVVSGKEIKRVQLGAAEQLVISGNGKLAAYAGMAHTYVSHTYKGEGPGSVAVGLYDLEAGKKLPPLKGDEPALRLAFLPDSKHLLVTHGGNPDGALRLWDLAARKEVRRFRGLESWAAPGSFLLAVSPDGKKIAGGRREGDGLRVWETATGKPLSPKGFLAGYPQVAAFSADGKSI